MKIRHGEALDLRRLLPYDQLMERLSSHESHRYEKIRQHMKAAEALADTFKQHDRTWALRP